MASDYRAGYAYKGESPQRLRALMVPRILTNSSLHATVLVRLMVGTPRPLAYLWRRLMLSMHAMDVARNIEVGPGLELPHPFGIVIGADTMIGANVCIHQGVTTAPGRKGRLMPQDERDPLVIEDNVVVFGHAQVGARLGKGSVLANHSVALEPVPAGCVAVGIPARVVRRPDAAERLEAG